jgi:hypothetical protein
LTSLGVIDAYEHFVAAEKKLGVAEGARTDILAMATTAKEGERSSPTRSFVAARLEINQQVQSTCEYGPDLSRFPTEKQFVSHVTLVPHKPMSGGQPVRTKRRSSASTRLAAALRMAAVTLRNSATALGAYYRKMARRLGGDVAVFATARKLATLIYRLLRWGQPYDR